MTDWLPIASAPRDRVFLAWDGDARFLCCWHEEAGESGWVVAETDAPEDIAYDDDGRPRTADPTHWREVEAPPRGFV